MCGHGPATLLNAQSFVPLILAYTLRQKITNIFYINISKANMTSSRPVFHTEYWRSTSSELRVYEHQRQPDPVLFNLSSTSPKGVSFSVRASGCVVRQRRGEGRGLFLVIPGLTSASQGPALWRSDIHSIVICTQHSLPCYILFKALLLAYAHVFCIKEIRVYTFAYK